MNNSLLASAALALLAAASAPSYGQETTTRDLIGTWSVKTLERTPINRYHIRRP